MAFQLTGAPLPRPQEADYVRWGTVKRVTNLRKEQQDALWDGLVNSEPLSSWHGRPSVWPLADDPALAALADDFDKYWAVASKLVPLPSAPDSRAPTPNAGSSLPSDGRLPGANAARSVPLRVYLPRGGSVLQTVVPPVTEGKPRCSGLHCPVIFLCSFPPAC